MRLLSILIVSLVVSGCAGTGFHKQTEVMPDEFSISFDSNPQDGWNVDEVTGGFKWKLK